MRHAILFLAIGLGGCVSQSPDAARVRLSSNADLVRTCTFVQQESIGITGWETVTVSTARDDVVTKLKNRAAELGGTDVITNGPQVNPMGIHGSITGDIYRCN